MATLLYIQASPRGKRSKSIAAANAFVSAYQKRHPKDIVKVRDLFGQALPQFDGAAVEAKYNIMHGRGHSAAETAAWKDIEAVIDEFKTADKYVFAVPMWNFGIPYRLKQYIDVIVEPGYTFAFDPKSGYSGLVRSKPVLVVYARGGQYAAGSGAEVFDMQKKYLELVLGFIGLEKIQTVIIEPTLEQGPDVARKKLEEAMEKAVALAADF